jgi:hypothetical protein
MRAPSVNAPHIQEHEKLYSCNEKLYIDGKARFVVVPWGALGWSGELAPPQAQVKAAVRAALERRDVAQMIGRIA